MRKFRVIILFLTTFCSLTAQFPKNPVPRNGLVAYYPFCGNAKDMSGNGKDGIVNGATLTKDKFGNANTAYVFNGIDNYINIGSINDLNELSISAWIFISGLTGDVQAIVSSVKTNPIGNFVHFQAGNPGLNIAIYTDLGPFSMIPILSLKTGVWRHVALTVKSGLMKVYENGNQISSNSSTYKYITGTTEIRVGSGYDSKRFFNGKIDDIFIYNRALSDAEIQQLYNAGPPDCLSSGFYQEDISDTLWSIVKPELVSRDIDLGEVCIGSYKDSVLSSYLKNTGTFPFLIDSIRITGTSASEFYLVSQSAPPAYKIQPGEEKILEVGFKPSGYGIRSAILEIYSSGQVFRQTIQGFGINRELEVITKFIDFGKVKLKKSKDTTITIVIENKGNKPINIINTIKRGPDTTHFEIISGGGIFLLAPGEKREIIVRFSPSEIGRVQGLIEFIALEDCQNPIVQLFGEGIPGGPEITTTKYDSQALVCFSEYIDTISLSNPGGDTLVINALNITGANLIDFAVNEPLPISIEPDSTKKILVYFIPQSTGQKSAGLEIKSNADPDSLVTIPLSASKDSINLAFVEQTIDLGVIFVNQPIDTNVTITNFGSLFDSGNIINTGTINIDKNSVSLNPGLSDKINIHYNGSANPLKINETLTITVSICGRESVVNILLDVVSVPAITLMTPDLEAYPGEIIDIPVILKNELNLAMSGVKEFEVNLNFNTTLLTPLSNNVQSTGTNSGLIILTKLPADVVAGAALTSIKFKAGLGDATECKLLLTDAKAVGGTADVAVESGTFRLLGICPEGGNRLINPSGNAQILSIMPNPSSESVDIIVELIETGYTKLYISDILGREKVNIIDEQTIEYGARNVKADISSLESGVYLLVLKTPTVVQSVKIEVLN
jgi:hypothetical protein